MTATTRATVRARPPRATGAVPMTAARLLRIELRRNAMPLILPLIAALFWFDSYRPSTATPPLYVLRTFWNMGQGHTIIDFGPLVAPAWPRGSGPGMAGGAWATWSPRPRGRAGPVNWPLGPRPRSGR